MRMTLRLLVIALLFCVHVSYGQSPPNLTANIAWSSGTASTADVEAAFNNARATEETQLGLAAGTISTMSLPAGWAAMSDNAKALWILNDERTSRAGIDYPGDGFGAVKGLPLQDTEMHLNDITQSHAEWLMDKNTTGHTGACGHSPFTRIDNHPVIGKDIFGSTDCHEFMARGENIAYFWTSGSSIAFPIERSFYNWIYNDAGSAWGHREACLLQDLDLSGNAWGYNDNYGPMGSEGFLGFGRMNGPHNGWNFGEVIVMKIIDPSNNASCGAMYAPENGTLPTGLMPTTLPTATATYNADRYIHDEATGFTHYIDNNGTHSDFSDDLLLLSVDRKKRHIGNIGDCTMDVELIVNNNTLQLSTATAPYVTDPNDWFCMERYWDLTPTDQPIDDVNVRHYFTTAEYTDVMTSVAAAGGTLASMNELYFYKVTGENPEDHANIDPAEYHEMANGTVSTSAWALGSIGSENYAEFMVSSFSGGGGGAGGSGQGALPVELNYFELQKRVQSVDLNWATSLEVDNAYFTIERSENGFNFNEIARVQGNGTTDNFSYYAFSDFHPNVGHNYYRLKQTDFDGMTRIIGDIKQVVFDLSSSQFEVYPNPAFNDINIHYSAEKDFSYELRNVAGQLIKTGSLEEGVRNVQVSVEDYKSGIYYMKITDGITTEVIKVVKQ